MKIAKLQTFADAERALEQYIPIVKEMTGKDITLDRMLPMMAAIGNPQEKLKVIHVAGTSGKTSTAYYVASLLMQTGATVGLTVSPHIDVISERLQINLKPLLEADFCNALEEFLPLIRGVDPQPSYFELLMALAYWYFARKSVDYAVIETGFGGLHDASNICQNSDKICVLTDIGFDHMHILGNSLPEISGQKAGIMHQGNQAFCFEQPGEVMDTFQDYADKAGAKLSILSQSKGQQSLVLSSAFQAMPIFQQRNWLLARAAYDFVAARDGLAKLNLNALEASMKTYVPGRMDSVHVAGKELIMDGAHNQQKMAAFVMSFKAAHPGKRVPLLIGMKAGKEYQAVLPLLRPITSELIVTSFDIGQDIPSKPIDPQVIAEQALADGFRDVRVVPNSHDALKELLTVTDDLAVITGSFYLLAGVRPLILKA